MATLLDRPTTDGNEMLTDYVSVDREKLRFRVDRKAYSDQEIFLRERETIFRRCWL